MLSQKDRFSHFAAQNTTCKLFLLFFVTQTDNTGKIDIYKQFKFLLKCALWHDFLVHFSFCLKVRVF